MSLKKLGDFVEIIMGQAPPSEFCNSSEDGVPFVKAGEFGEIRPVIREWTTKPLKLAEYNDILICVVGATAGKLNRGEICAIGRSVAAIRADDSKLNIDYLYYFLKTWSKRLNDISQGAAQAVITREMIREIQIPLPPLTEQQRIADLLDAADALRQKDKTLLGKYEALGQSLFLELFGDPVKNEKGWEVKKFEDYTLKYNQGVNTTTEKIEYSKNGVFPIIRAGEVGKGYLNFESVVYVNEENETRIKESCKPKNGDILYANIGANLGTACLVNTSLKFGIAWNVFRVQLKNETNNLFFLYQLNSGSIRNKVWTLVKTATVPFISGKQIADLDFINPPQNLQLHFASQIQLIEQQKAKVKENLAKSEELFNGLLAESFG